MQSYNVEHVVKNTYSTDIKFQWYTRVYIYIHVTTTMVHVMVLSLSLMTHESGVGAGPHTIHLIKILLF